MIPFTQTMKRDLQYYQDQSIFELLNQIHLLSQSILLQSNNLIVWIGIFFIVIGIIGILIHLLNPFHFIGGFLYVSVGGLLVLSFGREVIVRYFPPVFSHLLYERRYVEYILHSNAFYQIMGMLFYSMSCIREEIDPSYSSYSQSNSLLTEATNATVRTATATPSRPITDVSVMIEQQAEAVPAVTVPGIPSQYSSPLIGNSKTQRNTTPTAVPLKEEDCMQSMLLLFDRFADCTITNMKDQFSLEPFFSSYFSILRYNAQPKSSLRMEVKWMMLSELFLSCLGNYLQRQWKIHSKYCMEWLWDQYYLQQKLFFKSIQQYCEECLLGWWRMAHPFLSFPFLSMKKESSFEIRMNRAAILSRKMKKSLSIKQTTKLSVVSRIFHVTTTAGKQKKPIPFFQQIHQLCLAILSVDSSNDFKMINLKQQQQRTRNAILLSFLLVNMIAYRFGTIPRKVRWLQIIFLRKILSKT